MEIIRPNSFGSFCLSKSLLKMAPWYMDGKKNRFKKHLFTFGHLFIEDVMQ